MTYENEGIEVYTIVESEIYTKLVADILTQKEQEELATFIASEPECGDVIPASGGCRVIYFNRLENGKICLLLIYTKAKSENIPAHILKQLKQELEVWL